MPAAQISHDQRILPQFALGVAAADPHHVCHCGLQQADRSIIIAAGEGPHAAADVDRSLARRQSAVGGAGFQLRQPRIQRLASGCRRVIAMMQHLTKKNEHKLVRACDYPLTAAGVVSLVITDYGVFEPTGDGFRVVELAPGVSREQAQTATGAPLR